MQDPKINVRVIHSKSKPAWNIVGTKLGGKYKIASVPYVECLDKGANLLQKAEAYYHAKFIEWCFNNSTNILAETVSPEN